MNAKRFGQHALFWGGCLVLGLLMFPPSGNLGSINGLAGEGFSRYYQMAAIRIAVQLTAEWLLCYPLLYLLVPLLFGRRRYLLFALSILALLVLVSVYRYWSMIWIYNPIMHALGRYENSHSEIFRLSIIHHVDGPAYAGFLFITLKLFRDWRAKQHDLLSLQKEQARAEMALLQSQVHPHFLFNCLNNIYSFTLDDRHVAADLVKRLRRMLHYMTEESGRDKVELRAELALLEDYFSLQRVRYESGFDLRLELVGDPEGIDIAPLLLIPFVENSFKHGASRMSAGWKIRVALEIGQEWLKFRVDNDKPPEMNGRNPKGLGISNTEKRLRLLYSDRYRLTVEEAVDRFTIDLQIPVDRADAGISSVLA